MTCRFAVRRYVLGSTALTALTTQWMAVRVALARAKYGVSYPDMYADSSVKDGNVFNCIQVCVCWKKKICVADGLPWGYFILVQRGHQNTLEYLPNVLALQALMGLQFPITAAGLGVGWAVARILYSLGYSTGDPSKRSPGSLVAGLVYLGLIGGTMYAGYSMII